jgi:pyrroloquinoline quinone biosynthesis protein B
MHIRILGSAAGGGFPQWNCNCTNCTAVRQGDPALTPRTQSSIAVSGDGQAWLLVNASPDILTQVRAMPELQPARALRDSGIAAILLMDAQIDHVTGLLMLREHRSALPIYATPQVLDELNTSLPLIRVLSHYAGVVAHPLSLTEPAFNVVGLAGVRFSVMALSSNAPPFSPRRDAPLPGDNIGLVIEDSESGKRLFYAPGLGRIEPAVAHAMTTADVVLVDGTFWRNDEMQSLGFSHKTAAHMGHLAQSGPGGMLEVLAALPKSTRKILIHINNTNPILRSDSPERAALTAMGIEVAWDGMVITLGGPNG